jgi:iron complex outermembrane receptor protein
LCDPFTRQPGGNLNPPSNSLANLGKIETDGVDIKLSWASDEFDWGRLSAALQSTYVNDYEAIDADGNVAQRQVGVEVSDSAIPEWQTNLQLGWGLGSWDVTWALRYISAVEEKCSNAPIEDVPGCESGWHELDSTLYNDVQVAWLDAFTLAGLKLTLGINNIFGEEPPICYTCSLNGYDAGTYDLPGAFWNVSAKYKF